MKNTKKILTLAVSVVLLMGVVLTLSSCSVVDTVKGWFGMGECEHTYAEAWTTDAENHWHAATCEHTEEKGDLAAHADADKDGKCDTCEYKMYTPDNNGASKPEQNKPATKTTVVYNVTVVNANGEAVEGVEIKLLDKESTRGDGVIKATDADGKVSFEVLLKEGWYAIVYTTPAGYGAEMEAGDYEGVYHVIKYEFDESNSVTITLVDVVDNEAEEVLPEGNEPSEE